MEATATLGMAYIFGFIFGLVVFGGGLGMIPFSIGSKRGRKGLGIAGLITCLAGQAILGVFLSIPACIIFTIIICVLPKIEQENNLDSYTQINIYNPPDMHQNPQNMHNQPNPNSSSTPICSNCWSPIEPGTTFCTNCGRKIG